MARVLDLRAEELNIRFTRGTTFSPIFYYLGPGDVAVSLAGYIIEFSTMDPYTLNVVDVGITTSIVVSDIQVGTKLVVGANGILVRGAAADTKNIDVALFYECNITSPEGISTPISWGSLEPYGG